MTYTREIVIGALGIALTAHAVAAQDLTRYRTFELGSTVASVVTATGVSDRSVKTLHVRPSLLQDIEWWPSPGIRSGESTPASNKAVDQMRFSFYDGRLFRIVINYGHQHTDGLTDTDMIEAISTMYGPPLAAPPQASGRVLSRFGDESRAVVATWGNADAAIQLNRAMSYGNAWRLVVTQARVETLARQAEAQAERLDAEEAPQREIERQLLERQRDRAATEKARDVNKLEFQP
jgi:hypothetical protein